jgi:cysteine desulfurase
MRSYLDFNATQPPLPEVVAAVAEAVSAGLGNPASPHEEGRRARAMIEEARRSVELLLGAAQNEVVFTSGGTEANAAAVWGLVAAPGALAGRTLLLSAVEHPAVRAMAEALARHGVIVVTVPVRGDGIVDLSALEALLAKHQGATLALQLANSETGVVQPLREAGALAARYGAALHCDAVQAAGKVAIASGSLGVATLAVSGHKFGAPPGVGALVVRREALAPLIPGTQEAHRRGGTENLPGIVGMGVAARLAQAHLPEWQRVEQLRDRFEREVLVGAPRVTVHGVGAPRLANTSCLGLPPGCTGGEIVAALDLDGYAVSAGPACSSGAERPSPTIEAMGFGDGASRRTLRVSLGLGTGEGDVLGLAAALVRVLRQSKGVRR